MSAHNQRRRGVSSVRRRSPFTQLGLVVLRWSRSVMSSFEDATLYAFSFRLAIFDALLHNYRSTHSLNQLTMWPGCRTDFLQLGGLLALQLRHLRLSYWSAPETS